MASSSRDPNRQRNVYLMIGAVVVVLIWLLWTVISPGGSSTPSPTTSTTPTTATTPATDTTGTTGTTGGTDTTGTTGTTDFGATDTTGGTDTMGGMDTTGTTSTTGQVDGTQRRTVASLENGADPHARDRNLKVAAHPARAQVRVPVLMYHRVAPASTATNAVSRDLTVTPADFRAQMNWLQAHGYTAVSQADVFNAMEHGTRLPKKPVVITFDDGYVDATDAVLPVLQEKGWPATFFIITGRIGERAFLNWKQLKTLDAAGMDLGSHTVAHTELPGLSSSDRAQALSQSRSTLEKGLGHPVRWFCYPAGRNDSASAQAVAKAGYLMAYTTEGGSTLRASARETLPRVRVSGGESTSAFGASVTAAS